VLTVLLTSPRVAPGLLTWQAWSALRAAARLLARPGHPQLPALAAAGVTVDVLDAPPDARSLADLLAAAVMDAGGPVVWLSPPGEHADDELLAALAVEFRVLHGSHDLPGGHLLDVVAVMDTLRASCPWDRQQTHESLMRYLLEEAYEAVETVESGDLTALREELGDVLLQVAFHARIAAESAPEDGGYTIDDVADTLVAKLIRRHPHVFGSVAVSSAADVSANWEEIKRAERAQRSAAAGSSAPSVLDGVPFGQPALSLMAQLRRRAERAGFAESASGAGSGGSSQAAADIGDELMRVVARAQAAEIDPEMELRSAARRYADRVRDWERSGTRHS
jgi:XTP/dITP diphosphohydrolase